MPFIYITSVGIKNIGESSGSHQHSFLVIAYQTDCLSSVLYGITVSQHNAEYELFMPNLTLSGVYRAKRGNGVRP